MVYLSFIKSLIKRTWFILGLDCAKYGAPQSESFAFLSNPGRNKRPTSFLKKYSFILVTLYGIENICLSFFFHSKYSGSVFQVPSVPLKDIWVLVTP